MNSFITALAALTIVLAAALLVLNIVRCLRPSKPSLHINGGAVDWAQVTETKPGHISFLNPEGREVSLVYRDPAADELKLESIRRIGNSETRDYATTESQVIGSEASVPRLAGSTLRSISFTTNYEGKPFVRLTFGKGNGLFPSESHSVNVEIVKATANGQRA